MNGVVHMTVVIKIRDIHYLLVSEGTGNLGSFVYTFPSSQ